MTCPNCHTQLVSYFYGAATRPFIEMERNGYILIGGEYYEVGMPTYYCKRCQENHFFTDANQVKISSKRSYAKKQRSLPKD